MTTDRVATAAEELANALTHGLGLVLSLVGAPVLVMTAFSYGKPLFVIGSLIFAAALVTVYTTSTLYHAVRHEGRKQRYRLLDHVAIYLLIAGTYTPFTFGSLRSAWGWTLFAAVWLLAAIGIVFKCRCGFRHERLSTALYVVMGWILALGLPLMVSRIGMRGAAWLIAGGLLYTAGVVFYRQQRSWSHPVWHLFVMGGSACHYCAVLWYAAPAS
jgi:hemolysin III